MATEEGYTEAVVVAQLSKKGVKFNGKVAEVRAGNLGINALGKLDFLKNNCKYVVRFIATKEK